MTAKIAPTTKTPTTPKTAAEARKLLGALTTQRGDLQTVVDSSVERRKGHAVAAAFGDTAARASLEKIEAEENSARAALQNITLVISAIEQLHTDLQASEAADATRQREVEISEATDRLLAIDDEIDDALEHARNLLIKRGEIAALPIFLHARKHNFGVGGVEHTMELGQSLLCYFDKWLNWLPGSFHYQFHRLERVSDWDSRQLGKKSPRMLERGPRAATGLERSMLRALTGPSWINGDFGFDSAPRLPGTKVLKPGDIPDMIDDEASLRLSNRSDRVRSSASRETALPRSWKNVGGGGRR